MAEYIERETFLKDIAERYCLPCKEAGRDHKGCKCRACWVDDMRGDVIDAAALGNDVTVQEWVSVEDRLPDKAGRYLAVKKRIAPDKLGGNRTDIVILRFFVDDGFRIPTHIPDWINEEINEEVTHWMPLPNPPKGE